MMVAGASCWAHLPLSFESCWDGLDPRCTILGLAASGPAERRRASQPCLRGAFTPSNPPALLGWAGPAAARSWRTMSARSASDSATPWWSCSSSTSCECSGPSSAVQGVWEGQQLSADRSVLPVRSAGAAMPVPKAVNSERQPMRLPSSTPRCSWFALYAGLSVWIARIASRLRRLLNPVTNGVVSVGV